MRAPTGRPGDKSAARVNVRSPDGYSLTADELESVLSAAVEVVAGRVPLICRLAEITLEIATKQAHAYEALGAQGLMVFPSLGYTEA